jgi:hypothetical protein
VGIFTGEAVNPILANFMSQLALQNRGVYKEVR